MRGKAGSNSNRPEPISADKSPRWWSCVANSKPDEPTEFSQPKALKRPQLDQNNQRGKVLLGSRPPVVRDHRYGYCYQFSAASPTAGQAVGHSCARANTDEMNRHLLELIAVVPQGRHGVVVLDGAGWHRSDLEVPDNLTLLRLPPYSPELNLMENVFGVLKRKHFANRVFATVDDVRKTVDTVWQKFANTPEQIASIMSRQWATLA